MCAYTCLSVKPCRVWIFLLSGKSEEEGVKRGWTDMSIASLKLQNTGFVGRKPTDYSKYITLM